MTEKKQIYKCEACGNIIEVLHEGPGELVCCGQAMSLQSEKSEDEGNESSSAYPELKSMGAKHLPIIEGNKVKVGSVEHPMEDEHYIEWIEATSESELESCKKFLKSSDKPEIEFPFPIKTARAYCNIHGLWAKK
jgi:superoxide reductase